MQLLEQKKRSKMLTPEERIAVYEDSIAKHDGRQTPHPSHAEITRALRAVLKGNLVRPTGVSFNL